MTNREEQLKPCPCGQTPDFLSIDENGQGAKWATATPECCGEWMIEFRTQYNKLDSLECMTLAIAAWNSASRPTDTIKLLEQGLEIEEWNTRPTTWISCKERLPEEFGIYLIAQEGFANPQSGIMASYWNDMLQEFVDASEGVTHWQPLPPAPRSEG